MSKNDNKKQDMAMAYAEAIRTVMERVIRILLRTNRTHVVLDMSTSEYVPSYTDGRDVFLSYNALLKPITGALDAKPSQFNDKLQEAMKTIKGMNYHEMLHILFTPRVDGAFKKRLDNMARQTATHSARIIPAYRILEDQRIETLGVALYPLMGKYFTNMVAEYLLDHRVVGPDGEPMPDPIMYQLICGRKYLPSKIRHGLRAEYAKMVPERTIREMEAIVSQYKRVRFSNPSDVQVAVRLVDEFAKLLSSNASQSECASAAGPARGNVPPLHQGEPDDKATEAAIEKAVKSENKERDQGSGNSSEDEDGEGEGEGAGSGSSSGADELEEVQKALEDATSDPGLQADAEKTASSIKQVASSEGAGQLPSSTSYTDTPVTGFMLSVSGRVVQELQRLRFDTEPVVLRDQIAGRLNLRRMMSAQPGDLGIFNQWTDELEKETGIEVWLLIDTSGSMGSIMKETSQIMWVFKHSFGSLDTPVTILLFRDQSTCAYSRDDRVGDVTYRLYKSGGGTVPTPALLEAERLMQKSSTPNKVLITVTDGIWAGIRNEDVVDRINKLVVTSMIVHLGNSNCTAHRHRVAKSITSLQDLPLAAADLVNAVLAKALANVTQPT